MKWNFACKPVRQLWNIISLTFRPFAFQANIKQRLPPLLNVALCLGQRKDQIYFAGYAVWSVASRLKVTFSFHLNCRCPLYSFHSSRVWRCSLTKKATRMWREKEKETAWERERELVHSSENWPSRFELMRRDRKVTLLVLLCRLWDLPWVQTVWCADQTAWKGQSWREKKNILQSSLHSRTNQGGRGEGDLRSKRRSPLKKWHCFKVPWLFYCSLL